VTADASDEQAPR